MDINSKIRFKGKDYTVPQFKHCFKLDSNEEALGVIEVLIKKGSAKEIVNKTKEQKVFEKVASEEAIREMADAIDTEEAQVKDRKAQNKREGKATYKQIEVGYNSYLEAQKYQNYYAEALRLNNIEIRSGIEGVKLVFFNITDSELNFIKRTHTANKVVDNVVGTASRTAGHITDVVDYTAKNVIAPVAQIGVKAGVSIFKSLAHTVAKTGASLVNASSQGVKQTMRDIQTDSEIIRAGRELIETKDSIMRKVSGMDISVGSDDITVIR